MRSSFIKSSRLLLATTVALVCLPAAASARPIAAVPGQDLRSPDARDAARTPPAAVRQFASPDARDAALAQERYYSSYAGETDAARVRVAARQDLRSPDTRDVAAGREYPPIPTVVTLREVHQPEVSNSGFDWVAAGAGAGSVLGVILLTSGGGLLVRRRTRDKQLVTVS
jgi:hypothetical protein